MNALFRCSIVPRGDGSASGQAGVASSARIFYRLYLALHRQAVVADLMDGIDAGRHFVLSALMFYSSWFLSQFFGFYDNFILTVDLFLSKSEYFYGIILTL